MAVAKLILVLLCIMYSNGYYIPLEGLSIAQFKSFENNGITINIITPDNNSVFPLEIEVSYTDGIQNKTFRMQKNDFNDNATRILFGNLKNGYEALDPNKYLKKAHYSTQDNVTSATLMLNEDLTSQNVTTNEKFRILLTTTEKEIQTTVTPVLLKTKSSASAKLVHRAHKQNIKDVQYGFDSLKAPHLKFRKQAERKKRAVNGQPLTLYAETLIVADHSVLDKQKKLLNTNDNILCFQHMKIYYSHMMAAVALRYDNSLANDPDLKIKIRVSDFLFQTTQTESNWTNPTYVGVFGLPTLNGRVVVNASLCLEAFSRYMSGLSLKFDHAVGLMDKDMYYGSPSTVGLAWTPGMCQNQLKYSIVEDSGFMAISVIAHEMGHNFGSDHDGVTTNAAASACAPTLNYIMTPGIGIYTSYYNNSFLFSPCSITQFKSTILVNNGNVSSFGSCLLNVPTSQPIETTYFNLSMNGQLWSADFQCQMRQNTSYRWCPWQTLSKICESIYCTIDGNTCSWSNGVGAADGTPCGTNSVCQLGQCVSSSVTKTPTLTGNLCGPPSPCLNGGTCTVVQSLYICVCPTGYSGVNCEISSITGVTTAGTTTTTTASTTKSTTTTTTPATTTTTTTTTTASTTRPTTTPATTTTKTTTTTTTTTASTTRPTTTPAATTTKTTTTTTTTAATTTRPTTTPATTTTTTTASTTRSTTITATTTTATPATTTTASTTKSTSTTTTSIFRLTTDGSVLNSSTRAVNFQLLNGILLFAWLILIHME